MKTMIFLPPLPRMTGGLAVLLHIGGHLARAGSPVSFVARERAPWMASGMSPDMPSDTAGGPVPESIHGVPLILWDGGSLDLHAEDIWLVPEGWPHALLPGLRAGARTVVYVQNWAYLLSEWPEGLNPQQLPAHFLAVSAPVAWHVRQATGKIAPLLRPGIDLDMFRPADSGPDAPAAPAAASARIGRIGRIGWMPRKNKALARQIRELVTAWRALRGAPLPEWVEIHGMSQAQVAETLAGCTHFLATGFPEGCPLPPLEAMACGCVGVGFSGFGGWDYMRLAGGILPPWLPESLSLELRPANGFWVPDGDVTGAALALDQALTLFEEDGNAWDALCSGALQTAALYTLEYQERRVLELWNSMRHDELFGKK